MLYTFLLFSSLAFADPDADKLRLQATKPVPDLPDKSLRSKAFCKTKTGKTFKPGDVGYDGCVTEFGRESQSPQPPTVNQDASKTTMGFEMFSSEKAE